MVCLFQRCCFTRANRCRLFRGESDYGYCAAKDSVYYGFRGHLVVSGMGVITGFTLTPANGSERQASWDVIRGIRGLLIGDKGYISTPLTRFNLSSSFPNKLHTA